MLCEDVSTKLSWKHWIGERGVEHVMAACHMKKNVTHTTHFPCRYKYTYMEEMLSNVAGARQVFERWMEWEPDEQAWHSYINMELRYKEIDRARSIYERYVMVHPEIKNWVKFAKFEERQSNTGILPVICEDHMIVRKMLICTQPLLPYNLSTKVPF